LKKSVPAFADKLMMVTVLSGSVILMVTLATPMLSVTLAPISINVPTSNTLLLTGVISVTFGVVESLTVKLAVWVSLIFRFVSVAIRVMLYSPMNVVSVKFAWNRSPPAVVSSTSQYKIPPRQT